MHNTSQVGSSVGERTILKMGLKNTSVGRAWAGLIWLRIVKSGGL
jgi:hypothetical protein